MRVRAFFFLHQKRLRLKQGKPQPDEGPRTVAIDPGRVNFVTALDSQTGKTKTLTRGGYYVKGRIKKLSRKTAGWEIPLRDVKPALSLNSMRTCFPRLTSAYRQVNVRNHARLRDLRCKKKRAHEKLACYAGKQKVLDSFFAGLAGPGRKKPIIAYGAASFHHSGRGEMSVPVKRVLEVCCKHYKTVLVNEHLTTKVHHPCGQRLNPIARRSEKG